MTEIRYFIRFFGIDNETQDFLRGSVKGSPCVFRVKPGIGVVASIRINSANEVEYICSQKILKNYFKESNLFISIFIDHDTDILNLDRGILRAASQYMDIDLSYTVMLDDFHQ